MTTRNEIQEDSKVAVTSLTKRTVSNALHRNYLKPRSPTVMTPSLSKKHRDVQLKFCRDHLEESDNF